MSDETCTEIVTVGLRRIEVRGIPVNKKNSKIEGAIDIRSSGLVYTGALSTRRIDLAVSRFLLNEAKKKASVVELDDLLFCVERGLGLGTRAGSVFFPNDARPFKTRLETLNEKQMLAFESQVIDFVGQVIRRMDIRVNTMANSVIREKNSYIMTWSDPPNALFRTVDRIKDIFNGNES